jgi:hypothetical protein
MLLLVEYHLTDSSDSEDYLELLSEMPWALDVLAPSLSGSHPGFQKEDSAAPFS